jgi:hypothetical protein
MAVSDDEIALPVGISGIIVGELFGDVEGELATHSIRGEG